MVTKGPPGYTKQVGIWEHFGHTWLPSSDSKQKLTGAEAGTVTCHHGHLTQGILKLKGRLIPKKTETQADPECYHCVPCGTGLGLQVKHINKRPRRHCCCHPACTTLFPLFLTKSPVCPDGHNSQFDTLQALDSVRAPPLQVADPVTSQDQSQRRSSHIPCSYLLHRKQMAAGCHLLTGLEVA